jgi:protein SCO1
VAERNWSDTSDRLPAVLWDTRFVFKNRSLVYFALIALAAAAGGYMVARQLDSSAPNLAVGTRLPTPRPLAPFELHDHEGGQFDNSKLLGHASLLFFGYTHCPDVCPTTLALLSQVNRTTPVPGLRTYFITVDPGRDDQLTLKHYVDAFGGQFVGLRGGDAALEPLLRSAGAARSVQKTPDGGYTVDHSATLFFIDSKGRLAAVFTPPFSLAPLHADLAALAAVRN